MKRSKKKILYGITKTSWGGAQKYVYDLAIHFSNDELYEVSVVGGGHGKLFEKLEENTITIIPIPTLRRDVGLLSELRSFISLVRIIRRERPDVFHTNSSKMGLLGAMAGRLLFVPKVIFTAHAWPFNETRPKYQKLILKLLAIVTVLLSHRTIAVSENIMKALPFSWIQKKITPVYTGIVTPTLYEEGAFFTERSLEKSPSMQIVSIGELHTSKGFDRALIALASCKHLNWTYHILGTGEKREYLEDLIEKLNLKNRVMLHGFVENASLYLNSFDLFLFPSRTEALGYVGIEAIYSKIPIIASNVGGIPEVLFDDPYSKVIDCSNEKLFKETLLSMIKKPPHVDEQKRPGRLRFKPEFMFTATKKIYS
ncbi:MAG: hypothetical protein RI935_316 [Candidatus Parcubacteria bacterium]|jgi:glycosyltransferase involved in cell wall biosynthesis